VNKSLVFIKRECLTRIKTKAFIIGTLIVPLVVLVLVILPSLFMHSGKEGGRTFAVIDLSKKLVSPLQALTAEEKKNDQGKPLYVLTPVEADSGSLVSKKQELNGQVLKGKFDAFLVIPPDIFENNRFEIYAKNISNFELNESLSRMMSSTVSRIRLSESGLDPEVVRKLNASVKAETFKVQEGGAKKESGEMAFIVSYLMVFMIYMVLIFYGTFVMRGVIEDKTSRVVEVLLSSAKPHQIMAGKILGIGAAGLIQITVWGVCLLLASTYGLAMAKQFAPAVQKIPLPSISIWVILGFILFFLLGFFLYAGLYAALGSLGNSESEMQNLQYPILAPIVLSLMLMFYLLKNPDGSAAVVLSMIPYFSPILMFLRISLHAVPLVQVILCIAICLLTIAVQIWVSGRIFRVGILMYGKRPTLPEVLKWIRIS
jgi:ABC-2 type transport system permease protein